VYNRFNEYRRFMNGLERTNELHRWASSRTSGPPGPMASHALRIRLGAGAAAPGMLAGMIISSLLYPNIPHRRKALNSPIC